MYVKCQMENFVDFVVVVVVVVYVACINVGYQKQQNRLPPDATAEITIS